MDSPVAIHHNQLSSDSRTCHLQSRHHSKAGSIQLLPVRSTVRYLEHSQTLYAPLCVYLPFGLQTFILPTLQPCLLSSWSPLSFIPAKTNHHQHSAKLIELSLQPYSHLPFAPHDLHSFLSINNPIIHLPVVSPAQFMTPTCP